MARTSFDLNEIRTEAQRGLHAGVGAADLALEAVREYVADVQKRLEAYQKDAQKALIAAQEKAQRSVRELDFQPQALRTQATTVLNARVEELSKDARARRAAIEKRVAELQAEAQRFVTSNVENASGTFGDLAKRGETVVKRFRKQTAAVADPGPVSKATGATTTAKKAPAKKAPAKKASAKKTATGTAKSAAKKAPAKKTATGTAKSAAKKAPAGK